MVVFNQMIEKKCQIDVCCVLFLDEGEGRGEGGGGRGKGIKKCSQLSFCCMFYKT